MRLRYLTLLAALFIPSVCMGMEGRRLLSVRVCKPQTGTVNSINGSSTIDAAPGDGGDDTGVGTPSTLALCSGTASIVASCYGGTSGSFSQVIMKINGAVVQTLSCGATVTQNPTTLSWPVSGVYTAEVIGVKSGDSTYRADNFIFSVAQ